MTVTDTRDPGPGKIRCAHGCHGTAVVCGHILRTTDRAVGFVENSDDQDDLQAWCDDCEALFLQEQELTEVFQKFNGMAVVCTECYAAFKERHSRQ